jgi:hypothetical protein
MPVRHALHMPALDIVGRRRIMKIDNKEIVMESDSMLYRYDIYGDKKKRKI